VSGYGQPADRKRTRESGFDDHLVKPVDIQLLGATLERVTRDRT
jgi:DNA-binding response OmpR family regulator